MRKWYFFLFVCGVSQWIWAQPMVEQFRRAEVLSQSYHFEEAADVFSIIATQSPDTTERLNAGRWLILCENGQIMMRYIETPLVTGKATVPRNNFFNYYSFEADGKWAMVPAELRINALQGDTISPIFISTNLPDVLYFSAKKTDNWDIFVIRRMDNNRWTIQEPLDDNINTPFDERFPYVSPDGQTLYFSSNGHSGMGGYDLYKSVFDNKTQRWGVPENLGFPYSSPYDDWLYVPNTERAEALFASSREQKTDSVTIYRIAIESNPVKRSGYSIQEIQQIAQLIPHEARMSARQTQPYEFGDTTEQMYNILHDVFTQQQQDAQKQQNKLITMRKEYSLHTNEIEHKAMQQAVLKSEVQLEQIQADIRQTMENIRIVEQQLLSKGIMPEIRARQTFSQSTVTSPAFIPQYQPTGAFPDIVFLPPKQNKTYLDDDFRFRIENSSVTYTDLPILDGIVYRIFIGSFSHRLADMDLKGFSPVFISTDKKQYTYHIGQFTSYDEANMALGEVKRKKIKNAMLAAWIDGKKISIQIAREYEEKKQAASITSEAQIVYNIVLGEFASGLPDTLKQIVKNFTSCDIMKKISNGRIVYIVGPFSSAKDAQEVRRQLQERGFETKLEN